jgi:hypothetical protein
VIGTAADVVVGLVWLAAGGLLLAGRSRRSIGAYMALTGATWLAGSLADALALLHRGPLTQVLLAYPDAGPAGVAARVVVGAAYVDGAVPAVGRAPAATLLLAAAVVAVAAWRYLRTSGAVPLPDRSGGRVGGADGDLGRGRAGGGRAAEPAVAGL